MFCRGYGNPALAAAALLFTLVLLHAGCAGTRNVGTTPGPEYIQQQAAASVTGIVPSAAKAGATVELSGNGLGADAARLEVRFGGVAGEVLDCADACVHALVPLDAGDGLAVSLDGQPVEVLASFSYIAETLAVDGFAPREGPVGTEVLIDGSGFGEIEGWVEVRFGELDAPLLELAPEQLRTAVPADALSAPIIIKRGKQEVQTAQAFTVTVPQPPAEPPRIHSFAPEAVYPLEEVRVAGEHFGTDLAGVTAYVGETLARVAALSDTELVILPVPGTTGGRVRVVNAVGEAQSDAGLTIKPYPDYFAYVSEVSALRVGPGGLLALAEEFPAPPAGVKYPTLCGKEMNFLPEAEIEGYADVYRIPMDLEGDCYLGVPNKLKEEDLPEGATEDVWVTAYYEPVITVTTDGMNPPLTTGLEPYNIYGNYIMANHAFVTLDDADYTAPIAVFADDELIEYYPGHDSPDWWEEFTDQGGLPVMFNSPPELFELGEHSITVATAEGCSVADPGYQVLSLDSVEITVDSVNPQTARCGDLITLTGQNLHWNHAGSAGLSPKEVRVGGVRMPVVLIGSFPPNSAIDEMQFLLLGDAVTGEIEVDIQEDQHHELVRTIQTGLTLNVDREYLDGFERYYVPKDSVDFEAYSDIWSNRFNGLSESGELYVAYKEPVAYDEEYIRLGYFTSAGFTDLGRIDRAPAIFPEFTEGFGTYTVGSWVNILPNGERRITYYCQDERETPHRVAYKDFRIAAYDESGTEVYPYVLNNSEDSGQTDNRQFSMVGSFDDQGQYWGVSDNKLLRWNESGWEVIEAPLPEMIHNDPEQGELSISIHNPLFAESSGHLKAYGSAFLPPVERVALYFIERQPSGEWEKTQVLGRDEYPTHFTFDRNGMARVFTNDAQQFYIQREENGFTRVPWADMPYPVGGTWPPHRLYAGEDANQLSMSVKYDRFNRPIGKFGYKLNSTWEPALKSTSGTYYVSYILYDGGSGNIACEPVGALAIDMEPWCLGSIVMLGQVIDWEINGESDIQLSPSGSKMVITGRRSEYELVDTVVNMRQKGVYVYSRDL